MKTSPFIRFKAWGTAALAAACLFAFTAESYAGPRKSKHKHKHHHSRVIRGHHGHPHHHYNHPRFRNQWRSYPRSGFVITFGNGYAGRGYYYGPRGLPYYYRQPGVVFYHTRPSWAW